MTDESVKLTELMKYWCLEISKITRMCRLYFENYVMLNLSEKTDAYAHFREIIFRNVVW